MILGELFFALRIKRPEQKENAFRLSWLRLRSPAEQGRRHAARRFYQTAEYQKIAFVHYLNVADHGRYVHVCLATASSSTRAIIHIVLRRARVAAASCVIAASCARAPPSARMLAAASRASVLHRPVRRCASCLQRPLAAQQALRHLRAREGFD